MRDTREGWVAELEQLVRPPHVSELPAEDPTIGPPFGPIERFDVEWQYELTRDELLELTATRSYVIALSDVERNRLLARVSDLLRTHPALQAAPVIRIPHIAKCTRATLAT